MKVSNLSDCKGCKKKKYPELFSGTVVYIFELFHRETKQQQSIRAMCEESAIRKSGWSKEEVRILSATPK